MKLTVQQIPVRRIPADCVAVFVHEGARFKQDIRELRALLAKRLDNVINLEEFTGKESEILSILTERKLAAPRLFLAALGNPATLSLEKIRRAAAAIAKQANTSRVKHLAFVLPSSLQAAGGELA